MLSTIRHFQKGIMIAIAIVVVIAFTFFGNPGDPSQASNENVLNVNGKPISGKEALRLRSAFSILYRLGMSDFAQFLYGDQRLDSDYTDFAVNLTLFRDEAKKLGIIATEQQVHDAKRNLIMYQIGAVTDDKLKSDYLSPVGYTLADLYDLLADYVAYQQIRSLLESGVEPLDSEIEDAYNRQFATIHGSLVKIDRTKLEEAAEAAITDEQIAAHFEKENEAAQDEAAISAPAEGEPLEEVESKKVARYNSMRLRAVDLVRFPRPELAEDATAEARAEGESAYNIRVDSLTDEFAIDGKNFEEVANKNELVFETLEPFSPSDPPESLKEDYTILQRIFANTLNENRPVSDPFLLADESYIILHLREDIEPRPLTLEEAREGIVAELKEQGLQTRINEAVAEARSKITEALEADKSIAEAAKAAGLEIEKLPPFSNEDRPKDLDAAGMIADIAAQLNPGDLSKDPFPFGDNQSALVFVEEKELVKSTDEQTRRDTIRTQLVAGQTNRLMKSWFANSYEKAKIFKHFRLRGDDESATNGKGKGKNEDA